MTVPASPIIEFADVSKDYHGLRPLRIERLTISDGDQTAILGLDQPMAETFVNLVTGSALPDRGQITVFGRQTASIQDSAEWFQIVDRFGIVSERSVVLDALSALQNLAMPYTLQIDPVPPDVESQAGRLAEEVGLGRAELSRRLADLDAQARLRVRLGRALALDPTVLLLDHASAVLSPDAVAAAGAHIRRLAARRGCTVIAVTADRRFAGAVASRVLTLEASTGRLAEHRGTLDWLRFG